MTMEQTWRERELRDLRRQLPRHLAGALAAACLGAGAFGIALWATNPPPQLMRHQESAVTIPSPASIFAAGVTLEPSSG